MGAEHRFGNQDLLYFLSLPATCRVTKAAVSFFLEKNITDAEKALQGMLEELQMVMLVEEVVSVTESPSSQNCFSSVSL